MPLLALVAKFFWPLSNIFAIIAAPEKPTDSVSATKKNPAQPIANSVEDHAAVQLGTLPKLVIAAFIWHYLQPIYSTGSAAKLSLDWALPIIMRDLLITFFVAGGWDFLLYSAYSPFYAKMHQFKLNPVYPKASQMRHDMFWSSCSTIISSLFEIALLHLWAVGKLTTTTVPSDKWWTHVPTVAWLITMPYWRLAHFYTIHRCMHKWNTTSIPDVGAWLYKMVHSLHHKSRNPTAWSGVSMHPVESFTYYTAMLIPVAFGAHPLVALYTKVDLTLGALIGHDGFGAPGAASPGHWLHHQMVNCNFGENYAPFDWLFGTFAADEDDYIARFGKVSAAEAAKTKAH